MLTAKQDRFVKSYKVNGDAVTACIAAGYSEKTAPQIASRLLKHVKIQEELNDWRAKKVNDLTKNGSKLTKSDYIDKAVQAFEQLPITEPNAPRFYDIAGKALGYIGNNSDSRPSQIFNTQINITGIKTKAELWETCRRLIGNE